jgi:hypothetical protein
MWQATSEVSQRLINLHAWHVPAFSGELTAHYHSALAWCTPEEAFGYAWPRRIFRCWKRLFFYATPDQRVRADGAFIALALQQTPSAFTTAPSE